jgi:hypothetical protein
MIVFAKTRQTRSAQPRDYNFSQQKISGSLPSLPLCAFLLGCASQRGALQTNSLTLSLSARVQRRAQSEPLISAQAVQLCAVNDGAIRQVQAHARVDFAVKLIPAVHGWKNK